MATIKTRNWFYILTSLWMFLLLSLGSWWLYLVFKLHKLMVGSESEKFLNMLKWEGSFFFLLLILLGGSLFSMYLKDMKKSRSMQAFFSSLTHELKTPLASMKLQTEVIKNLIQDESHSHETLSSLATRLIEDTVNLESELEKTLQLSKIEQNAEMTLVPISLDRFLKQLTQKSHLPLQIKSDALDVDILGDELALKMIFRNLIENTKRHQPNATGIHLQVTQKLKTVEVIYDDQGKMFDGDFNQLGTLFYRHQSLKGSGIGLYLIQNLMRKMGGKLEILKPSQLQFKLIFKKSDSLHD